MSYQSTGFPVWDLHFRPKTTWINTRKTHRVTFRTISGLTVVITNTEHSRGLPNDLRPTFVCRSSRGHGSKLFHEIFFIVNSHAYHQSRLVNRYKIVNIICYISLLNKSSSVLGEIHCFLYNIVEIGKLIYFVKHDAEIKKKRKVYLDTGEIVAG